MKNYLFIFCLTIVLSACQTTVKSDNAKVKLPGDVSIELDSDNRDFCPPGHQKKNWC